MHRRRSHSVISCCSSPRERYRGDVHCSSLFPTVFFTLQIISRRSALQVTDIPTHFLMCRFLSDAWEKIMYRVQECRGTSRAPSSLSFHRHTRHCRYLSGRSTPATHRHHKYHNTLNITRHSMNPNTPLLHSSL